MNDKTKITYCNDEHICIRWTHPGVCPLCSCYERMEELEGALRDAVSSLGSIALWDTDRTGLRNIDDVRSYARARRESAREVLPLMCSCGCPLARHNADSDGIHDCIDCDCTGYEELVDKCFHGDAS